MPKIGTLYTLNEIVSDISKRMDDESHVRWTQVQKELAVQSSVRRSRGRWWESRIDDTQTYDCEVYNYKLPVVCESVRDIYMVPLTGPEIFVSPVLWYVSGDEIVFSQKLRKYDGYTLKINYLVYPNNLLNCEGTDGETYFDGNTNLYLLVSLEMNFSEARVGDEAVLSVGGAENPFYVQAVLDAHTVALHKPVSDASAVMFHIAKYTDLPYEYLMYASMAELYEMVSRNRPGIEVDEGIRWATYYRQLADMVLNQQQRHLSPTRVY